MLFYVSQRWLQLFDFRSSQYSRPTQKWVCGWTVEGRPCQLGPDAKGQCVVTHECRPVRRGDRWQCARSDSAGGRCSESPLPDGTCAHPVQRCVPAPSLRTRRGLLARWLSALTIGSMLLLIGGAYGLDALSSGDLTSHHADINACGDCHTNFDKGPAYWLISAFVENTEVADSRQCLKCHSSGISTNGRSPRLMKGRPRPWCRSPPPCSNRAKTFPEP